MRVLRWDCVFVCARARVNDIGTWREFLTSRFWFCNVITWRFRAPITAIFITPHPKSQQMINWIFSIAQSISANAEKHSSQSKLKYMETIKTEVRFFAKSQLQRNIRSMIIDEHCLFKRFESRCMYCLCIGVRVTNTFGGNPYSFQYYSECFIAWRIICIIFKYSPFPFVG